MATTQEKSVNVKIDSELHALMRRYCFDNGNKTLATFVEEAIADYLQVKQDEEGKWISKEAQARA